MISSIHDIKLEQIQKISDKLIITDLGYTIENKVDKEVDKTSREVTHKYIIMFYGVKCEYDISDLYLIENGSYLRINSANISIDDVMYDYFGIDSQLNNLYTKYSLQNNITLNDFKTVFTNLYSLFKFSQSFGKLIFKETFTVLDESLIKL